MADPHLDSLNEEPVIRVIGRLVVGPEVAPLELPPSRKARALLAYLATEQDAQSRPWLCDLLWDGPRDPRAALRWSLAKLRPLLKGRRGVAIESDRNDVALNAEAGSVDIRDLQAVVAAPVGTVSTEDLVRVIRSWRGPFLEGFELNGCHRFDAWRISRREWAIRSCRAVMVEVISRFANDPERSLTYSMHWLAQDPLWEQAYVESARALASLGRTDEATDLCDRAILMVEREFAASPSEQLLALRGSLQQTRSSDSGADEVRRSFEVAAARRALSEGRYGDAAEGMAMSELRHGDVDEAGLTKRLELAELYVHPAMESYRPASLAPALVEMVQLSHTLGRMDLVRHGLYLIANLHYQDGNFDLAYQRTTEAETAGRSADESTVVRSLADTARCLAMLERDIPRARRLARAAEALEQTRADPLPETQIAFGLIDRFEGRYEEAVGRLNHALELVRASEDDWWETYCLLWLMMAQIEGGVPIDALVTYGEFRSVVRDRSTTAEEVFAAVLAKTVRSGVEETQASDFDDDLEKLRGLDDGWMLAYALLAVAEQGATSGKREAASRRAGEALQVAEACGRDREAQRARGIIRQLENH